MTMTMIASNESHKRVLKIVYSASWVAEDVLPLADFTAKRFGPDFQLKEGQKAPVEGGLGGPKPVWYMPVKKQEGNEHFPALGIRIALFEENSLQKMKLRGLEGQKVTVKVVNVMRGLSEDRKLPLAGTFDAEGVCYLKITSTEVSSWFLKDSVLDLRINEELLDFELECPGITSGGTVLKGQSANRLFLYRKKVVVFLPGVFGAQVQLKSWDGGEIGYPNFVHWGNPLGQRLGVLECDDDGEPLIPALRPTIFNMWGVVYDVFDECRAARAEYFAPVPKEFRLIELHVFAYDWRGDLSRTAEALVREMVDLQSKRKGCLRARRDFDDEIALAGHSTGGVIMRKAMCDDVLKKVVSHAFFLNVPFRGAPKALGVIATGQDPPGGASMIPFIDAKSLRTMALSMPIVYHLAPTKTYPGRVATCPERPESAAADVELDKKVFVSAVIDTGFVPRPLPVKASGEGAVRLAASRGLLAETSDDWHELWIEYSERARSLEVAEAVEPGVGRRFREWFMKESKAKGIDWNLSARKGGGWNEKLAERAARFHADAEAMARKGEWADKSYIFYSIAAADTTLSVRLESGGHRSYSGVEPLLQAEGISLTAPRPWRTPMGVDKIEKKNRAATLRALTDETPTLAGWDSHAARGPTSSPGSWPGGGMAEIDAWADEQSRLKAAGPDYVPMPYVNRWTLAGPPNRKAARSERWQLYGIGAPWSGDGTVPTRSLLGFGGRAKVLKPIPGKPIPGSSREDGPEHAAAPSTAYVWRRIVEILQGVLVEEKYLEKNCDTVKGVPEGGIR